MKKIVIIISFVSCSIPKPSLGQNSSEKFATVNFNGNWKFIRSDIPEAITPSFNDKKWATVHLPHDWSIEGPFSRNNPAYSRGAWLPTGVCYYRKSFKLPAMANNKNVFIYFGGAYRNSEVWINGHFLGLRPSGYTSFFYDLTPFLFHGRKNTITVRLNNSSQPGSRWYSGTGIYRQVKLLIRDKLFIPIWGTYITTPAVSLDAAEVEVKSTIQNDYTESQNFTFCSVLQDKNGKTIDSVSRVIALKPEFSDTFVLKLKVTQPFLWSPESPYLYTVKNILERNGKIYYIEKIKTGIRRMEYDPEIGFILNGRSVKIKGVCLHHDGGPLGAAIYRSTLERQFSLMKKMGANAIRTSHNPMSDQFMNLCDSMGFLVLDEAFDEWEVPKSVPDYEENGREVFHIVDYYADKFDSWAIRDLADFVLRDRNHASVFMWSLGNEIAQTQDFSGIDIAQKLNAIVHKYDNRPTTVACNGYNGLDNPNYPQVINSFDIYGTNYAKTEQLAHEHKRWPSRKIIITECVSAHTESRRGDYDLSIDSTGAKRDDGVDAGTGKGEPKYLNFEPGIQAWQAVLNNPNVMGMFIWTGMDYLGEVTPFAWPARSSFSGVVDLCGFPKDGYYFYQSQWTVRPMIHIFPHWNWEGRQKKVIPVGCFTNCDYVELFVNGKSFGKKQVDSKKITVFNVPYETGEIRAIGYSDVGKRIAEQKIITADSAYEIQLLSEKHIIRPNNQDLIYIECSITDKNGNIVPLANNLIQFNINGPAEIIGVGNGNEFSHEPFKCTYRKAFNGKCLAIIKSKLTKGIVTFTATSHQLKGAKMTIIIE